MLNYDAKLILAFGETITGNKKILDWLLKNGYPDLAALSYSIRGSEEAFKFLLKYYPRLAALDAAIDNNEKAYLWLKEHNYHFNIIFADACHGKPEALKWLMDHQLEGFISVAEKIRYFRENQYFDIHKPPF
ncbi:MAG TPA: hypothetical protein DCX03_02630 [Bacteroidales bacterium]|jgi:hypothetical protein|nr:MAG: hypothetical protein XD81_0996 [Bacteroidetes bacterium 38_7]MBP9018730.1 hypothetical protein [Bacteroidales bacterium]HAL64064.1 hypothetical protein [Bacteroidales bacterium]HAW57904.1 hypothetical protein [Bacteroidales bacterium]HQQ01534.1 hypothetical protein [Bacteroidales bacterium]